LIDAQLNIIIKNIGIIFDDIPLKWNGQNQENDGKFVEKGIFPG